MFKGYTFLNVIVNGQSGHLKNMLLLSIQVAPTAAAVARVMDVGGAALISPIIAKSGRQIGSVIRTNGGRIVNRGREKIHVRLRSSRNDLTHQGNIILFCALILLFLIEKF